MIIKNMDSPISHPSPILVKRINPSLSPSRKSPVSLNTKVPEECKPSIIGAGVISGASVSSNPKPNQVS